MKKLLFLFAIAGGLFFSPANNSHAQDNGTELKIAVISINAILREAKAFISISGQIKKYREAFRIEIQKEEDALRNANQELSRQRTLLSAEAFAEKRQEFEKRVADVQRLVQQRKQNLDRVQAEAMKQIENALNEIVTNLAKAQNISLIIRKDQTILAMPHLQITKEVLELLDAKMPSVIVSEPAS